MESGCVAPRLDGMYGNSGPNGDISGISSYMAMVGSTSVAQGLD